jgi:hypothetical protein
MVPHLRRSAFYSHVYPRRCRGLSCRCALRRVRVRCDEGTSAATPYMPLMHRDMEGGVCGADSRWQAPACLVQKTAATIRKKVRCNEPQFACNRRLGMYALTAGGQKRLPRLPQLPKLPQLKCNSTVRWTSSRLHLLLGLVPANSSGLEKTCTGLKAAIINRPLALSRKPAIST